MEGGPYFSENGVLYPFPEGALICEVDPYEKTERYSISTAFGEFPCPDDILALTGEEQRRALSNFADRKMKEWQEGADT